MFPDSKFLISGIWKPGIRKHRSRKSEDVESGNLGPGNLESPEAYDVEIWKSGNITRLVHSGPRQPKV